MTIRRRRGRVVGSALARGASKPSVLLAELLEGRVLMNAVPLGPAFEVGTSAYSLAETSAAMDTDGDFAVGRTGEARFFESGGVPKGGAVPLNPGANAPVRVAAGANGDFVAVVPTDAGLSGSLFDADEQPRGESFVVASPAVRVGFAVAMDGDGDFVVVSAEGPGIVARRFDSSGAAEGPVSVVHTGLPRSDVKLHPSVAMDPAGDFVVAWESQTWDDMDRVVDADVYARRYDAAGAPQGEAFAVNTATPGIWPSVGMDADGDFVVAFAFLGPYARRYDARGAALGEPLKVNSDPANVGNNPSVAMDADGDFVVAWHSADRTRILARRFNSAAQAEGGEFDVTQGASGAVVPAVASAADGDFVVTWSESGPDVSSRIMARLYRADGDVPLPATVVGRHVFYNRSSFDGNEAAADAADDGAVATDKAALRPGQAAGFSNVTSYARGINGLMVDIANLPAGGVLTTDDFDFGTALRPSSVTVRRGAGVNGSDRVTLVWTDYSPGAEAATMAVANGWLNVTVKANARTGLAAADAFSFGNLIGEVGNGTPPVVNTLDLLAVRRNYFSNSPVTGRFDFDRDGRVSAADYSIARGNYLRRLAPPALLAAPRARRWPTTDRVADSVVA